MDFSQVNCRMRNSMQFANFWCSQCSLIWAASDADMDHGRVISCGNRMLGLRIDNPPLELVSALKRITHSCQNKTFYFLLWKCWPVVRPAGCSISDPLCCSTLGTLGVYYHFGAGDHGTCKNSGGALGQRFLHSCCKCNVFEHIVSRAHHQQALTKLNCWMHLTTIFMCSSQFHVVAIVTRVQYIRRFGAVAIKLRTDYDVENGPFAKWISVQALWCDVCIVSLL